MGKEIFVGRSLLKRFFKVFFTQILEEGKDSRSFLSFRKQRDQELLTPHIFLFYGEDGSGKSSALKQCIHLAQNVETESKKTIKKISLDFEEWYSDKCTIPSTRKELMNTLYEVFNNSTLEISSFFAKYEELSGKIAKISLKVDELRSDEWPREATGVPGDIENPEYQYQEWLQKKLTKSELELLEKAEAKLTDALVNGLIETSSEYPVLFTIDNYEVLSSDLENWFRKDLLSRLYDQKNRILFVISGNSNFMRKFRNEFPDEFLYPVNFSEIPLTIKDITRIASKLNINMTELDIIQIEERTLGIPIAVQDITDHVLMGIPASDILSVTSDNFSNPEAITGKFITYVQDQSVREQIFSLAMLGQINSDLLAQLWSLTPSNTTGALNVLSKQFSFVKNNKLHTTVKKAFRAYLFGEFLKKSKSPLNNFFTSYSDICSQFYGEQLLQLQTSLPASDKKYTDRQYFGVIVNLIESLMWGSSQKAFDLLLGYYLEFLHFNPSFAAQLLGRIEEFRPILSKDLASALDLLKAGLVFADRSLVRSNIPGNAQEKAALEYLSSYEASMNDLQRSLLYLKQGELELREGRVDNAMDLFDKTLSAGIEQMPEDLFVYEDNILLGYRFNEQGNRERAVAAFCNAVTVRSNRFLPWLELGQAYLELEVYGSCVKSLIQAVELNPDHQDAWHFLGLGYSAIEQHEEAVQAFSKALEKGPQSQQIWFEMAKSLSEIQKYSEAVSAYQKVVESSPEHFEAWFLIGQCSSLQGFSDEAIEAFKKAVEIKPDYIDALKALGLELFNRGFYQEAAATYQGAVQYDRKDSALWSNIALASYHAENYEDSIKAAQAAVALKENFSEPYMTMGHAQTALGSFIEANEAYDKASLIDPENPDIWSCIGNTYYTQSMYDKAIEAFNKAVKINPPQEGVWYNIGLAYQVQEKYSEAIKAFSKSTEYEPENAECWLQKGRVHMILEQYGDAAECFTQAVEKIPDSHDAWYRRGLACAKAKDHEEAINSFVKASELWNSDPDIWYQLGLSYAVKLYHEKAVQAFSEATNLAPTRQEIWFNLGLARQNQGQYEDAISAYATSLDLARDNSAAWKNLGLCQYYLGKYAEAKETFIKAVELLPDDLDMVFHLALCCHALGEIVEAIEHYEFITHKKPQSGDAWYNMGQAYHALGNLDKAIEIYKATIEKWPDNGAAWYNLGLIYHAQNEFPKAIKSYRQASKINPDQADIWYNLGIAFHTQEQYGEAIQAYRKVVQLSPEHHEANFNLGLAYHAWGQYDDAISAYLKAVQLKADNFSIWGNLAIAYFDAGNYEKATESASQALAIKADEPWILSYVVASTALTGNIDKSLEFADSLIALDTSGEEVSRAKYHLNLVLKKIMPPERIEEVLGRLEAVQNNETVTPQIQ